LKGTVEGKSPVYSIFLDLYEQYQGNPTQRKIKLIGQIVRRLPKIVFKNPMLGPVIFTGFCI